MLKNKDPTTITKMAERTNNIEKRLLESIDKGACQTHRKTMIEELDRHKMIAMGLYSFLQHVPLDRELLKKTFVERYREEWFNSTKTRKGWTIDEIEHLFKFEKR